MDEKVFCHYIYDYMSIFIHLSELNILCLGNHSSDIHDSSFSNLFIEREIMINPTAKHK